LADLVDGKIVPQNRRKEGGQQTNIVEQRYESAILSALYDIHYEALKAVPKAKRKFQGDPSTNALILTAKDAAKLGILGNNGRRLSTRAISDRRAKSKSSEVI
jgi:hypothetical protein